MAAMYMQWHGPYGLLKIAKKVRFMSQLFMEELHEHGIVFATDQDRKSTRLNSSHSQQSRMPSSA